MGKKKHKNTSRRHNYRPQGTGTAAATNRRRGVFYQARPDAEERVRLQEARIDRMEDEQRAIVNKRRQLVAAELQARAAEETLTARSATEGEKAWLAECWALVELRRTELQELESQMVKSAASAEHRGTKSYRPVPEMSRAPRI